MLGGQLPERIQGSAATCCSLKAFFSESVHSAHALAEGSETRATSLCVDLKTPPETVCPPWHKAVAMNAQGMIYEAPVPGDRKASMHRRSRDRSVQ